MKIGDIVRASLHNAIVQIVEINTDDHGTWATVRHLYEHDYYSAGDLSETRLASLSELGKVHRREMKAIESAQMQAKDLIKAINAFILVTQKDSEK